MEADCVAEPTPIWGDQNHSSPRAGRHYAPIEVHHPVLVGDVWGQELDLRPFGNKVHESLNLKAVRGIYLMSWPISLSAHLEIHPTASRLRMMSPSGYEVTTETLWMLTMYPLGVPAMKYSREG